jgi:S-methylmethionine-dependent homocysteine/selenocysteine methylase
MTYEKLQKRLQDGGIVILDGGTGTELERRGVPMDPEAWCGTAALENVEVLVEIHRDYISAGADVITANTYASSRLMLEQAGLADRFETINRATVGAARRARKESGRKDVLIAGSISHRSPMKVGAAAPDPMRKPSAEALTETTAELAELLKEEGCDLIILEMMYDPDKLDAAFSAAASTGLPVWAGFSVRRGGDGSVLAFLPDHDVAFRELLSVLKRYDVAAAGIMHSQANVTADALAVLQSAFDGPLLAYPDSGYFKSPTWVFEDVIPPEEFHGFARAWIDVGLQIVGGCCGLTPAHIEVLGAFKNCEARSRD